jgi:excisionase family DNA binding protein
MTDLLTPDQVAEILSVSRARVIAMARGGGLPSLRLGREYRFPRANLNAWIEQHTAYADAVGEA